MNSPETAFNKAFLIRFFAIGIALSAITLGFRAIAPAIPSAPDFPLGVAEGEVNIEVLSGETGIEIARKLAALGVVKSAEAFFRQAVGDPRSATIAAGTHRVQKMIPAKVALDQLLDAQRIIDLVKVRDGAWVSEIKSALTASGFKKKDLELAFKNAKPPTGFELKGIEGFLYPAFYSFPQGTSAQDAISAMVKRFLFSTKDVNWLSRSGYSADQVVIIASLIESEGTPDVHRKVARVIYNRLEKSMPLQFDSTVHYILGRRGEIFVSLSDTKIRNRYNTFLYPGLPPGPIGSPTRASIDAALDPEPGDWLYFVTVEPARTVFTSSYEEFLTLKSEYKKNLKAGKFK